MSAMIDPMGGWIMVAALTVTGDCTLSTPITATALTQPDASTDGCQILGAEQLGSLGEIEFIDVRAQRGAPPLNGVRTMNLVQLADRPPRAEVTRVLLGNGLDDSAIAQACRSTGAGSSVVLRGGVQAWSTAFTHPDAPAELQRSLFAVSVAESLTSPAILVIDRDRDPSLSSLLVAAEIPFVDVRELVIDGTRPLVFVDQDHWVSRLDNKTKQLSYYLQGGSDALVQELTRIRPDVSTAGVALVRPCYFP